MQVNAVNTNNFSVNSGPNAAGSNSVVNSRAEAAAPLLTDANSRPPSLTAATAVAGSDNTSASSQQSTEPERNSESVRVSSSIGRAASAGQLTREQALEIYRNIAQFL
tara:strand:- start:774 stop:1097 length:324 start_codon:yes stop_codon:yes gene_type:complete